MVTYTIALARALAAETLTLKRQLSDLVNQANALIAAEIALMWKTVPLRMPTPPPVFFSGMPEQSQTELRGPVLGKVMIPRTTGRPF